MSPLRDKDELYAWRKRLEIHRELFGKPEETPEDDLALKYGHLVTKRERPLTLGERLMEEKDHEGPGEVKSLQERCYLAYGSVTDFKNFRGEPMPAWEALPETIQRAWQVAAAYAFGAGRRSAGKDI